MTAPIFRFMAWLEHRRTLCPICKQGGSEGFGGYCSDECAVIDADNQAIA